MIEILNIRRSYELVKFGGLVLIDDPVNTSSTCAGDTLSNAQGEHSSIFIGGCTLCHLHALAAVSYRTKLKCTLLSHRFLSATCVLYDAHVTVITVVT